MEDSIFTKIINGEIPSHKIYEDDKTLAFLDIFPETQGHTLVIPKAQIEFIWDLPEEDYAHLMNTVQKVGKILRERLGTTYVGSKVVGTDVPHAHVHLLPFNVTEGGNPKRYPAPSEPDHVALAALAQRLFFTDEASV